jgi:PAS domain S-box-containing protein
MNKEKNNYLVDGKYSISDLVDLNKLRSLFEGFTKATGFTIGFLDYPGMNVLIASGWKDMCTMFHRTCPGSLKKCKESNLQLLGSLKKSGQILIEECENGLVDCATPIIIKGKHIASLATGQLLLKTPDRKRFIQQAKKYGYNEKKYLQALEDIPVVSKTKLKQVTLFLGKMAIMISELGYVGLRIKKNNIRLEHEIADRKKTEDALRRTEAQVNRISNNFPLSMVYQIAVMEDGSREFTYLSDTVRRFYGVSPKQAMENANLIYDKVYKEDRLRLSKEEKKALKNLSTLKIELRMINPSGNIRWSYFISNPRKLNDRKIVWDGIETDITERKKREEAFRETQIRYRAIFDNTYQFTGLMTPDGILIEANKTAMDFTGAKSEDVINKPFWKAPWWRHSKAVQKKILGSIREAATGKFVRHETSICAHDHTIGYIDFSIKPVKNEDGKVIFLIPEGRDITEQKKLEEIKKSKEYIELIYKLTPSAIFTVDKNKRVTSWNKKAEEITGYKEKEIIGNKCTVFSERPCKERCGLYASDVKKPIIGKQCTIITKGKKIKIISKNTDFLKDKAGNILGGIESFEDITMRKKMEDEIKESGYKVRAVFDQAFQFIGLMNLEGVLIEANRAALDFAGMKESDVLNKPFWETPWWTHSVEMQNKLKDAFCRALKGEFVRFEATHLAKNGSLHYVDFSIKPIKDERGKVVYLIPEGRDITELKKLQEKVMQTEKLSALGKLAGSMSHELRNPLAVIKNAIYFLQMHGVGIDDVKREEYMNIMKRNIETASKIVGGVLEFSKNKNIIEGMHKICNVIDDALAEVDIPAAIKIEKIYKENPEIQYDIDLIKGAFVNILTNSIQAIKGEGRIEITAERKNGFFEIVIRDNGCGIAKSDLAHIFEPLFSRKIRGVGFGLSIVKNSVERHGWGIYVESQLGEGTSVTVKIPLN